MFPMGGRSIFIRMMLYISSNKPATPYKFSQYRPRVMTDVFINMAILDFHAMFADS